MRAYVHTRICMWMFKAALFIKVKQILYINAYIWTLVQKKWCRRTYLQGKNTGVDTEDGMWTRVGGARDGGGMNWEIGIDMHTPMCKVKMKVARSCATLWDPMDYTVHGILQARILEWVVFPFSRASSAPWNQTLVSCIADTFFIIWVTRVASHV